MDVDRARVMAVIHSITDAIISDRAWEFILEPGPTAGGIVERACAEQGLGVEEWSAAVRADAELLRFFDQALVESVVEQPDPGPYDKISRESPRGEPDPLPEGFERDARLLGRPLR